MTKTTKVDKRGRVTIPKEFREAHHIDENTEFIIEDIDDDTFILKKIDLEELIGSVKKEIQDKDLTKIHSEVEEEADELTDIASRLYSEEKISLERAMEIAEKDLESMKEILESRGISIRRGSKTKEEMEKAVKEWQE